MSFYMTIKTFTKVDTAWTDWSDWSSWSYECDRRDKHRDRQCPGSLPRGEVNIPSKTPQFGGKRDCDGNPREEKTSYSPVCNGKY